ncbi:UPF0262 family protein [Acidisphaera rubrifaciens]|uniref:UPF0262 protein Asru_0337_05 n=1 Tax=Acidisphaera rubrifaciens HS-AP3 TaxID=1231350 RepID=A0A0D6P6U9_9PROT|nr:UPF0262 family protein [Acidisphaera rubrifaciens]GAN77490.1 hypothetical protein Asru_0337_05 [Acidisphaera rubrifaciens HS-AP3]
MDDAAPAAPTPTGAAAAEAGHRERLVRVVLAGEALTRLSPILEADRAQAVADLESENRFAPVTPRLRETGGGGPFVLHLSIQEGRLVFDIRAEDDAPLGAIVLALGPFRALIKDYQLLVDSHMKAVEEGREARIQAIDMGRRGLHNEGANLMIERLDGKIGMDLETARRLFTLVCVLHQRI